MSCGVKSYKEMSSASRVAAASCSRHLGRHLEILSLEAEKDILCSLEIFETSLSIPSVTLLRVPLGMVLQT